MRKSKHSIAQKWKAMLCSLLVVGLIATAMPFAARAQGEEPAEILATQQNSTAPGDDLGIENDELPENEVEVIEEDIAAGEQTADDAEIEELLAENQEAEKPEKVEEPEDEPEDEPAMVDEETEEEDAPAKAQADVIGETEAFQMASAFGLQALAMDFATLQQMIDDAPAGEQTVITIDNEIVVEDTLLILGKNILLNGTGTLQLDPSISDGFSVEENGALTVTGITLQGQEYSPFGIYVEGTFEIGADAVLRETTTYVNENAILNLSGGLITGNTDVSVIKNHGTFTMASGSINDNIVGNKLIENSGVFTMAGGSIQGNTVDDALIENDGVFTMEGGSIHNNHLTYESDDASVISNQKTFVMQGDAVISGNEMRAVTSEGLASNIMQGKAAITNNTSTGNGGAFYLYYGASLTMQGNARIEGNKAVSGGGIYAEQKSGTTKTAVTLAENALVTGNQAQSSGGGVYIGQFGFFTMQQNAAITGNTAFSKDPDSSGDEEEEEPPEEDERTLEEIAYDYKSIAYGGGGLFIMDGGNLLGGEISGNIAQNGNGGGIYAAVSNQQTDDFVIDGTNINNNTATYAGGGMFSEGSSIYNSDRHQLLKSVISGNMAEYGGGLFSSSLHIEDVEAANADEFVPSGQIEAPLVTISTNKALVAGGGIYVAGDIENSDRSVLVEGNEAAYGGGIYVPTYSGRWHSVCHPTNAGHDQLIELAENANAPMPYILTITNNKASQSGGGIYNNGEIGISLIHVEVSKNTAADGGGMYLAEAGKWAWQDGGEDEGYPYSCKAEFTGNTATQNGGGIYYASQEWNMFNSYYNLVTYESQEGSEEDITAYLEKPMSIYGNVAQGDGGGMYVASGSALLLGVNFGQNNAQGNGGGMYVATGAEALIRALGSEEDIVVLETPEPTTFTGNTAQNGGAIYNSGTVKLHGAVMDNNTASLLGQGACHNGELFVICSDAEFGAESENSIFLYPDKFLTIEPDGLSGIYSIEGFLPGDAYEGRVVAVRSSGNSAESEVEAFSYLPKTHPVTFASPNMVVLGEGATATLTYVTINGAAQSNAPADENAPEPQAYVMGTEVSITSHIPVCVGWEFTEWNTDPDGNGDAYSGGHLLTITQDTILYAQYIHTPYWVTFNYMGAAPSSLEKYYYNDLLNQPNGIEYEGYTFGGWQKEDGSFWDFEKDTMPTEDIELFAYWVANPASSSSQDVSSNVPPVSSSSQPEAVSSSLPVSSQGEQPASTSTPQGNSTVANTAGTPLTGDDFSIVLAISLLLIGFATTCVTLIIYRRRSKQ
ncbi:InlB B-repeat-containing protein [Ruminococcaceae bacterium OttesenSCG-928-A16]|nr:InlB B-repeat-containing protein [Ruminococcaceae bacterium OttesenSCG-928-A16]